MKAGLIDLLLFASITFTITIIFFTLWYGWNVFTTSFKDVVNKKDVNIILDSVSNAFNVFGNVLVFFYIFLLIAGFISAYFSNFHPALFFIAIIFFSLSIIFGYVIKDTILYLASWDVFNNFLETFTYLQIFFSNITLILSGFGLLYAIIMFMRKQEY
ncbi:MAG: hypothetical protein QXJ14_02720 [Candidatus Aenigmatarchaeota archaeon]